MSRPAPPDLGDRMRAAAPIDDAAAQRAWARARAEARPASRAALGEGAGARRADDRHAGGRRAGGRRRRPAVAAGCALVLAGAVALSPAGARVSGWIDRAVDPPARPTAALPAPGRLLVSGPNGSWLVEPDLSVRPLAEFAEAAWSAKGNFVALNRGDAIVVREDGDGETRWTLARPDVTHLAWSPGDGYRVAYRSGSALRVVAGDGTGDRLVHPDTAAVTPAWRPGPSGRHELAYALPRGQVNLRDVDRAPGAMGSRPATGAGAASDRPTVLLAPSGQPVGGLAWVGPNRLLVLRGGGLLLLDARGRLLARIRRPAGGRFETLAASAAGRAAAFVRRAPGGTSIVWTVRFPRAGDRRTDGDPRLLGGRARIAFAATGGEIAALAFSPDGRWLAFAWPPSDQWLFQRVVGRPQLRTVEAVAAQLGHIGDPAGDAVVGWAP